MSFRNFSKLNAGICLVVLCITCANFGGYAIAQDTYGTTKNELIPFDPSIRTGKLKNGFTYYLCNNNEPEGKVLMHLVIKAGSKSEDNDQEELAHLLEHLPFDGTKHFPNPVGFFEAQGLRVGNEINARTLSHFTSYKLKEIPSDNSQLINKSLLFLRDCAQDIILDSNKVNKQRGTVLQELNLKDTYIDLLEGHYKSMITGDPTDDSSHERSVRNLKHFNYQSLERFYKDWYRPDLQAIIVIGNIDIDMMERSVMNLFSDLENPTKKRAPKNLDFSDTSYLNNKYQYIPITHALIPQIIFKIYHKLPYKTPQRNGDYKYAVAGELYNEIMGRRLLQLIYQENSAFDRMSQSFYEAYKGGSNYSQIQSVIMVKDGAIKKCLLDYMIEIERVKRYGFTETELEQAKSKILKSSFANSGNHSDDLANNLEYHFVYSVPLPSNVYKNALLQELINSMTLGEINQIAKEWLGDNNYNIVLLAPVKDKHSLPSEVTIKNWLQQIRQDSIDPSITKSLIKPLLTESDISALPGQKAVIKSIAGIGVTHIRFANGVQVYLKPLKNGTSEKIYMQAIGDQDSNKNLFLSKIAASVVGNSGLGQLDRNELLIYKNLKGIQFNINVSESHKGIYSSAEISELESLLQMVYLYFTKPIKDQDYYSKYVAGLNQKPVSSPSMVINRILMHAYKIKDTTRREEEVTQCDLDKIYTIFKEMFGNGADFTFVLSGNFDEKRIISTIGRYLGNLPAKQEKMENTELKSKSETIAGLTKTFYDNSGRLDANVQLIYPGFYNDGGKYNLNMETLKNVLNILLTQRLRRDEGGVYNVHATCHFPYKGTYSIVISFGCAASNVENMIKNVEQIVEGIKRKGPDARTLKMATEMQKVDIDQELGNDLFWANYLTTQLKNKADLKVILVRKSVLERIKVSDIQEAALMFLDSKRLMKFVVMPKNGN